MKVARPWITIIFFLLLAYPLTSCTTNYNYDDLEYFEGQPHISNETLGMLNYLHSIATTPGDAFPLAPWGDAYLAIPDEMSGGANWLRYMLAFLTYAGSMAAETTPAYRIPYVELMDGLITKMQDHIVWDYWIAESHTWGGENPIDPYNIMYTGHLQLMMAFYERQAGDGKYRVTDSIVLTKEDGSESWVTDLNALSARIHYLILNNQDYNSNNYYGVPCETPMVFVVCNSVPQLAFEVIPSDIGLDPAVVHEPWIDWIDSNLIDPVTKTNYFCFWPGGIPDTEPLEFIDPRLQGGYSSWAYAFTHAFDPDWVMGLYPTFMEYVLEDLDNPPDDEGPAIIRWGDKGEIADPFLFDMVGTGFTLWLTKEVGDLTTYARLKEGFHTWAGQPQWANEKFGYFNVFNWPIFQVIPLGFDLLGRLLNPPADPDDPDDHGVNFRSVALSPRDSDFYAQPILASLSNPGTFVNQAIWKDPSLYITINGAHVTTDPTDLVIGNLEATGTYQVLLNGAVYTNWTKDGTQMTITTPALSGEETQRYQIIEQP